METDRAAYDENAEVLDNLRARGEDLTTPRLIDFSLVFSDEASARTFAQAAEQRGFTADVKLTDYEDEPWDVTASRVLTPTCREITDTEETLARIALAHGGRSDGWGFLNV